MSDILGTPEYSEEQEAAYRPEEDTSILGESDYIEEPSVRKSLLEGELTNFDISEYEDYFPEGITSQAGLDASRAERQTAGEQFRRAIGTGLVGGLLSVGENAGYLLDIADWAETSDNMDNWLSESAREAKESLRDEFAIYKEDPSATFDFSDPASYAEALSSTLESAVGFGITGALTGSAIGAGAAALLKVMKGTAKGAALITQLGTATALNYAEARINAAETRKSVMDKALMSGIDYKTAEAKGNEAMHNVIWQSKALILTDAAQVGSIFKSNYFTQGLKDKAKKNLLKDGLMSSSTEYLEEVSTGLIQKEVERNALIDLDIKAENNSTYVGRAFDYITSPDGLYTGIMGVVGGPVQSGMMKGAAKLQEKVTGRAIDDFEELSDVNKVSEKLRKTIKSSTEDLVKKAQAIEQGDSNTFEDITSKQFEELALDHFNADKVDGLRESIQQIIDDENLPEEDRKIASEYMTKLPALDESYNKIRHKYGNEGLGVVNAIYKANSRKNSTQEVVAQKNNDIASLTGKLVANFKSVSDEDINPVQFQYEALKKQLNAIEKHSVKFEEETGKPSELLRDSREKLEVKLNEVQEQLNDLEQTKGLPKEVKAFDEYEELNNLYKSKADALVASQVYTEHYNILTDPKFTEKRQKALTEDFKQRISESTNADSMALLLDKAKSKVNDKQFKALEELAVTTVRDKEFKVKEEEIKEKRSTVNRDKIQEYTNEIRYLEGRRNKLREQLENPNLSKEVLDQAEKLAEKYETDNTAIEEQIERLIDLTKTFATVERNYGEDFNYNPLAEFEDLMAELEIESFVNTRPEKSTAKSTTTEHATPTNTTESTKQAYENKERKDSQPETTPEPVADPFGGRVAVTATKEDIEEEVKPESVKDKKAIIEKEKKEKIKKLEQSKKAELAALDKATETAIKNAKQKDGSKQITISGKESFLSAPYLDNKFNAEEQSNTSGEYSTYRVIESSDGTLYLTYNSENAEMTELALNSPDIYVNQAAVATNAKLPEHISIRTLEPGIVELRDDIYVVTKQPLIEYTSDNVSNTNTFNIKGEAVNTDKATKKVEAERQEVKKQNDIAVQRIQDKYTEKLEAIKKEEAQATKKDKVEGESETSKDSVKTPDSVLEENRVADLKKIKGLTIARRGREPKNTWQLAGSLSGEMFKDTATEQELIDNVNAYYDKQLSTSPKATIEDPNSVPMSGKVNEGTGVNEEAIDIAEDKYSSMLNTPAYKSYTLTKAGRVKEGDKRFIAEEDMNNENIHFTNWMEDPTQIKSGTIFKFEIDKSDKFWDTRVQFAYDKAIREGDVALTSLKIEDFSSIPIKMVAYKKDGTKELYNGKSLESYHKTSKKGTAKQYVTERINMIRTLAQGGTAETTIDGVVNGKLSTISVEENLKRIKKGTNVNLYEAFKDTENGLTVLIADLQHNLNLAPGVTDPDHEGQGVNTPGFAYASLDSAEEQDGKKKKGLIRLNPNKVSKEIANEVYEAARAIMSNDKNEKPNTAFKSPSGQVEGLTNLQLINLVAFEGSSSTYKSKTPFWVNTVDKTIDGVDLPKGVYFEGSTTPTFEGDISKNKAEIIELLQNLPTTAQLYSINQNFRDKNIKDTFSFFGTDYSPNDEYNKFIFDQNFVYTNAEVYRGNVLYVNPLATYSEIRMEDATPVVDNNTEASEELKKPEEEKVAKKVVDETGAFDPAAMFSAMSQVNTSELNQVITEKEKEFVKEVVETKEEEVYDIPDNTSIIKGEDGTYDIRHQDEGVIGEYRTLKEAIEIANKYGEKKKVTKEEVKLREEWKEELAEYQIGKQESGDSEADMADLDFAQDRMMPDPDFFDDGDEYDAAVEQVLASKEYNDLSVDKGIAKINAKYEAKLLELKTPKPIVKEKAIDRKQELKSKISSLNSFLETTESTSARTQGIKDLTKAEKELATLEPPVKEVPELDENEFDDLLKELEDEVGDDEDVSFSTVNGQTDLDSINIPAAESWLKKSLPYTNLTVVNGLLNVPGGGFAEGSFRNGLITLSSNASKGTQYHEAWHAVSQMYLTEAQRIKIYDRWRKDNNSTLDNKKVEEKIAEELRQYMFSNREVKVTGWMKWLYDAIMDFIDLFRNSKHQTFSRLRRGQFDYKPTNMSDVELFSETTLSTMNVRDAVNTITYHAANKMGAVDFDRGRLKNSSFNIGLKYAKLQIVKQYKEQVNKNKDLATIYYQLIKDFDTYAAMAKNNLISLDIVESKKKDYTEEDARRRNYEDYDVTGEQIYSKSSLEYAAKDNATGNVKLMLGFIPDKNAENNSIGGRSFYPAGKTWIDVARATAGIVSEGDVYLEMYKAIEEKATIDEYSYLTEVLKRLKGAEEFQRTQFVNAFSVTNVDYRAFISYMSENGDVDLKVVNASSQGSEKIIEKEWTTNFTESFLTEEDAYTKPSKLNTISRVIEEVTPILQAAVKREEKRVRREDSEVLSKAFTDLGIPLTIPQIENYFLELTAKKKTIKTGMYEMSKLFLGNKNTPISISSMLEEGFTWNYNGKNPLGDVNGGSYLIQALSRIASYSSNVQGDSMILGPEGNKYSTLGQYTQMDKTLALWKRSDSAFTKHVNQMFHRHSFMLQDMGKNKGRGIENYSITTHSTNKVEGGNLPDSGSKSANLVSQDDVVERIGATLSANFPILTFGDKPTVRYLTYNDQSKDPAAKFRSGIKFDGTGYQITKTVTDQMIQYFYGEYERIVSVASSGTKVVKDRDGKDVTKFKDEINGGDLKSAFFGSLSYGTDLANELDLYGDMGKGKVHLLDLKDLQENEVLVNYMKELVEKRLKEQKTFLAGEGILIDRGRKIQGLDKELTNFTSQAAIHNNMNELLADYWFMGWTANVETMFIFGGDPAFYSDVSKRIQALGSDGQQLRVDGERVKRTYNVAVLNDLKTGAAKEFYDRNLAKLIKDKKAANPKLSDKQAKKEAKEQLKPYEEINQGDAQCYITLARFREIQNGLGNWTPEHEATYQKMLDPNVEVDYSNILKLQALKGTHFEVRQDENGRGIPSFLKYSQAVLHPRLVKDTQLENVLKQMEVDNVDELLFESAMKLGATEKSSFESIASGETVKGHLKPITLSNFNWKLQVDNPSKYDKKGESLAGSQVKKNILANIALDEDVYSLDGKMVDGREIQRQVLETESALSDIGRNKLLKQYGITQDVDGRLNVPESLQPIYDSLLEEAIADSESINTIYALENNIPLDAIFQIRDKIESKLLAAITKSTVKFKMPGGAFIQMSNAGMKSLKQLSKEDIDISKALSSGLIQMLDEDNNKCGE